MNYILLLLATLAGLILLLFLTRSVLLVRQSEAMVIERLGKFNRRIFPGLRFLIPFLESARSIEWRYIEYDAEGKMSFQHRKISRIDLRETIYDFPKQNVITSDNVVTEINALLSYQITDPKNVAYEINNLPFAIEKLAQTALRSLIGEMTLDQTLASREVLSEKMRVILDEATDKWGVKINRVSLQDINPPEEIRDDMEKVMRADRDRRAAVTQAEGKKTAAILESEGQQGAIVNNAEADKRRLILKSEGEAYARVRVAQAEADAIRRITEALHDSKIEPTQYMIAMRYIDTLKEMVSGKDNKVVYLPFEATGVLSALGGIKEIFKDMNPAPKS